MLQEDRGSCRASLEWEHSLCALEMIALLLFSALLCDQAAAWGIRDGVLHNSIWLGKECGGVFTDSKHVFKSPGYPNEYEDGQICYWHIRVKLGQRIQLQFLEFDVEEDMGCLSDYLEVYDSYDDVNGFVGRITNSACP
ncbi:tumor necrosis factor-inducible protein 6 protein [Turdus rufiventris]|nr:tumor necrosis factor-inducible protein 6 protein [Turdus rufiventris]